MGKCRLDRLTNKIIRPYSLNRSWGKWTITDTEIEAGLMDSIDEILEKELGLLIVEAGFSKENNVI